MNYIEALEHRYSVKKFDSQKRTPEDALKRILKAGQLSPSSLGLQPYKIFVVKSEENKNKLIPAFHNPSQISTCSELIVLVTKKTIEPSYIDGYFRHIEEVRGTSAEELTPFREIIDFYIQQMTPAQQLNWNEKQSYIVLGNLMFAAALENVDSCPMEGYKKDVLEDLLELDTESETATVTLALGYRADDDFFQTLKKVRKPDDKLFRFL